MHDELQGRAVHAASGRSTGTPSSPPIDLSTTWVSAGDPTGQAYTYARSGSPAWSALEEAWGALESARTLAFASGQAASFALVLALCEDRPRLVLPHDGYFGLRKLGARLAPRGIECVSVDQSDLAAVERELARGRSVLWCESPSNPMLRLYDLGALAALAQRRGAPMVADNTTATPVLQRPLDLGATAVVTSLTKSSSGHSDVIMGAVTTRDDALHEHLTVWRALAGAIPGPFEAWVAHRGVLTLPLRIARQSETTSRLAALIARSTGVTRVHHPSLDERARQLSERQMKDGWGPLLSFEVEGGAEGADRVVAAARLIRSATSFGGVESSWERRGRWAGESAPAGLIRLSVGLEAYEDLAADVEHALSALADAITARR
jgi:cystathionine beta-lyase/cystathionine gamma-synthase